jgi:hypothetical protein
MAHSETKLSMDQQWKVEASAFATLFFLLPYKSIGTSVKVSHREIHNSFWGGTSEWVAKPATQILIENTYAGTFPSGPGNGSRTESNHNASFFESKLWAIGLNVTFYGDLSNPELHSVFPDAPLVVTSVTGQYIVTAGGQVIRGSVSA